MAIPNGTRVRINFKEEKCYELYGIDEADLLRSRRGVFNKRRTVAIYLTRRLRGGSLSKINDQFQMNTYSSVSGVIERVKALMNEDLGPQDTVEYLANRMSKSQEQSLPLVKGIRA